MMFDGPKNFRSDDGDRLTSRARREASRRAPDFSDSLHDRIMEAVQNSAASNDDARIVPRPADPVRKGPAVAAVLVAVVALVVLNRMHFDAPRPQQMATDQPAGPKSQSSPVLPPSFALDTVPAQVQTAIATAVDEQKFCGLDHDARRMTQYLVDQVPFLEEWNASDAAKSPRGNQKTSGEIRD
jgi:hypothetical protein